MKTKLFVIALLAIFSLDKLSAQEGDVYLIDPIIEVPDNRMMARFFAQDTKDWGWTMMDPQVYHQAGYTGEGTVFFVIDTGVESEHEDLKGKVIGRKNWTLDKQVTHGHGTWCASRIASPDNGFGVVGIAPGSVIYDLQVLDGRGTGSTTNVAAAYRFAADVQLPAPYNNWRRVTTASLGSPSKSDELEKAMQYANSKGVVNFAAAGNSYREGENTVNCPGCYTEYAVTVAANDQQKQPAYFSSAGPEVDVTAPGVSLNGAWTGNSYRISSGTSMSTPAVAAALALFSQKNPQLSGQKLVEAFFKEFATDAYTPGFDNRTGHGIVILPKYFNGETEPPQDTLPPTPDPEKVYKERVVMIPIRREFKNLLFKSNNSNQFRFLSLGGIVVEYKTTKSVEEAYECMQESTAEFFTNRGVILPEDQETPDYAASWLAFFYRLLSHYQGYDVTIREAWGAEGDTLFYYHKDHEIKNTGFGGFLKRKPKAKTLNW